MKSMSIKAKLITTFATVLILINILGFYALYSMSVIAERVDDIAVSCMEGILDAQKMSVMASDTRRYEMHILLQQDKNNIQKELNDRQKVQDELNKAIESYLATMDEAIYFSEEERQQDLGFITNVRNAWAEYLTESKKVIDLYLAGNTTAAHKMLFDISLPKYTSLIDSIDKMSAFNLEAANESAQVCHETYKRSNTITWIIIVSSILLVIILSYQLYSNIKQPIEEISRVSKEIGNGNLQVETKIFRSDEFGNLSAQYNNTIKQMRNLISQIQQTAEHVAASSQELSAVSEQSSGMTQTIAQKAANVSGNSEQQVFVIDSMNKDLESVVEEIDQTDKIALTSKENTDRAAEKASEGLRLINNASHQMQQIETSVGTTSELIQTLGDRSNEIGQIVDAISAISSQTNLLALNAAIEAARAGEHGRGFAVVAEEVRKLAEESQKSTEKISELIKLIQSETQSAVQSMDKSGQEVQRGIQAVKESGEAFGELAKMAGEIGINVNMIAGKMQTVTEKSGAITVQVNTIHDSSQAMQADTHQASEALNEQTAAIEEIAAASNALSNLAETMQQLAQKFKL